MKKPTLLIKYGITLYMLISISTTYAQNFTVTTKYDDKDLCSDNEIGPKRPGEKFEISITVKNNLQQEYDGNGNLVNNQEYEITLDKNILPSWFTGWPAFKLTGKSSATFPVSFTPPTDPERSPFPDIPFGPFEFEAVKVSNPDEGTQESFTSPCSFVLYVDGFPPVVEQVSATALTNNRLRVSMSCSDDSTDPLTKTIKVTDNGIYNQTFSTPEDFKTVENLNPNKTYYISVTCKDKAGNVSKAKTTSILMPPAPPRNLVANVTSYSCQLSWQAPSLGAVQGYNIYDGSTQLNTSLITITTYTINGLCPNTTKTYEVRSQYNSLESLGNPTYTVTTPDLSLTISGPDVVCTGAQFSVNNLPPGTSAGWQHSSNFAAGYGTSSWVGLSLVTPGYGWVKATISGNGCYTPIPTKYIWGGKPTTPYLNASDLQCAGPAVVYDVVGRYDHTYRWNWWTSSYRLTLDYSTTAPQACVFNIDPRTSVTSATVYARATNTCGTSQTGTTVININGGLYCNICPDIIPPFCSNLIPACQKSANDDFYQNKMEDVTISVSPSPTTGLVEISIDGSLENDYLIEVYNHLGNLVQKSLKQNSENFAQVDLTPYPSGIYLIRIKSEKHSYQSRIIKN